MIPPVGKALKLDHRAIDSVWRRYGDYLRRPPLLSIEWADRETPARGWLVINSLRGGAAGGGTRMRPGLSRREVVYLAKTMELKFLFSGPPIGGAKSGIDFNPGDSGRAGVLRRWFRAISPQLHAYYGTGGDLNVDELLDVIPCCSEIGLRHPQEGIVRGHLCPDEAAIQGVFASLDEGIRALVDDDLGVGGLHLPVADLITGYGLARAILRFYEAQGRQPTGTRVLLEGFGAVGGPCSLYLARAGMKIVGIADREKCIVSDDGLSAEEVASLLIAREDKCLPASDPRCLRGSDRARFHDISAELFVCAAASGTLDQMRLEQLEGQGVSVIGCGANQPFAEAKLGATRVQRLADRRFGIIPDIVANCGMARAFSYLMKSTAGADPADLFRAVDDTITSAVREIDHRNQGRPAGILAATLGFALDRVDSV
ncbi:Glu/Leu/Phe/Val dehydrogenase family protein [soil metagenome]